MFEFSPNSRACCLNAMETVEKIMAVRVGFEPTVPVKVRQFSRLLDSTNSRTSPQGGTDTEIVALDIAASQLNGL
mgnify:CR=1 FL=1